MNKPFKFRQALYSGGKFCGFHHWGVINGKFVSPATSNYSGIKAAERNSQPYIGRKDMNKNDIYGGDICKVFLKDGLTEIMVVKWDENTSGFMFFDTNGRFWRISHTPVVIIGNIYEPSLIKSCGTCHDHLEHCPECKQDEIDFAKFKNKEEK